MSVKSLITQPRANSPRARRELWSCCRRSRGESARGIQKKREGYIGIYTWVGGGGSDFYGCEKEEEEFVDVIVHDKDAVVDR